MKRFPAIGTRLRDMNGIVWTVIESLDSIGILEAHGLWRKASIERIAGWVVLR
jgi:hypothetical protein